MSVVGQALQAQGLRVNRSPSDLKWGKVEEERV